MKTKKDYKFKNHKHRCPRLKDWNGEEDMPKDFWNYRVNPITGYYVNPFTAEHSKSVEKKYGHLSQPDPK